MPDNQNEQQQQQPQNQQNQQANPDFSALIDPTNGKILGKYENADEARKGYWNSVTEMNATKEKLNMALEVIGKLQSGQPQQPSSARPDYEQRLETLGIPVSDLDALINARAEKIASTRVQAELAPLLSGMTARSEMQATYPDFLETEAAALDLVNKSPALKARFDALLQLNQPTAALELAYFYNKQFGTPKPNAQQQQQKVAAGMPQGTGGAGRVSGMETQTQDQKAIEVATLRFHETGDPSELMMAVLGNAPLTYTEHMRALQGNQ